jgi:hypothetical protein
VRNGVRKLLVRALVYTTYEYFLIVLPVALYVFLASLAGGDEVHHVGTSPEWNIATIFLIAQAQSLYRLHIEAAQKRISHPTLGLIALFALLLIVFAATNIQMALRQSTTLNCVSMWALFLLATGIFVGFVTGSKLLSLKAVQWQASDS